VNLLHYSSKCKRCEYCNAAHSFIGEKLVGINAETIQQQKKEIQPDVKHKLLYVCKNLTAKKGHVILGY